MSKHVSPVEKYPGAVELKDPLGWDDVIAFEAAIAEAQEKRGAASDRAMLPGLLACIARFEVTGLPEHPAIADIPAVPVRPRSELVRWLTSLVLAAYVGEREIPNA